MAAPKAKRKLSAAGRAAIIAAIKRCGLRNRLLRKDVIGSNEEGTVKKTAHRLDSSCIQQILRRRMWEAAHVELKTITLDTDTTVHTLFGHQMGAEN